MSIESNIQAGEFMLFLLDDQHLIETYISAVNLNLEKEFISMLKEEIERRRLNLANINDADISN